MVTRLAERASVLLAVDQPRLRADALSVDEAELSDHARLALGDALRDVPGPLIRIPFDVLPEVAARDLDQDVEILKSDPKAFNADHHLLKRYFKLVEFALQSESRRRTLLGLNRLAEPNSVRELVDLLAEFPELKTVEAREELKSRLEAAETPAQRRIGEMRLALLRDCATGDFESAWQAHDDRLLGLWRDHLGPRIANLTDTAEAARADGDLQAWGAAVEELLTIARETGIEEFEAQLLIDLALHAFDVQPTGTFTGSEVGIELVERLMALESGVPWLREPDMRASTRVNLAAAYGARERSDPEANRARAVALLEEALGLVSVESNPEMWAMAHTNLGLILLGLDTSSADDASISTAIEHFELALRWRSLERNPVDWGFTQLNLGIALCTRRDGDRAADLLDGRRHLHAAAEGFQAAEEPLMAAQALISLATASTDLAGLPGTSRRKHARYLREAVDFARGAIDHRAGTGRPSPLGADWIALGRALDASGKPDHARKAFGEALAMLTPISDPRGCRTAARSVGALAAAAGDWSTAASAWETAVNAAVLAVADRASSSGRLAEIRRNVNLFRFAAYALIRDGRPERAVEVLELGRARELSVWLERDVIDVERLTLFDPQLLERLQGLQTLRKRADDEERAGLPQTFQAAQIAREVEEVIGTIRCLPGFERFLVAATLEEISSTLDDGEAFVYVLTAPAGAAALVVMSSPDGPVVKPFHTTAVDAIKIDRLLFPRPSISRTVPYVVAQDIDPGALESSLSSVGDLIGPHLIRPIAEAVEPETKRLILIPISTLGLLPLSAFPIDGTDALIDRFEVLYAPSAATWAVCKSRAQVRGGAPGDALVVGNPLPHTAPLPAAEDEARLVARALGAPHVALLLGKDGTKKSVVAKLPRKSHVHLACHGFAAATDAAFSAGLSLADEEVLWAREIVSLEDFNPRLVVLSACQSATIQGYDTADEALGLTTLFVGAGAAGAIGALWPIDDYSAALMMSRFYEFLAEEPDSPASALRRTQMWLRGLTASDEQDYLKNRPLLRQVRSRHTSIATSNPETPFSSVSNWGGFVLTGA